MDRETLEARLERVRRLRDRAATEGERAAAAAAAERLEARLDSAPAGPRGDGFHGLPWAADGAEMPSRGQILATLARWEDGDRGARWVGRWASWFVDKLVLPDLPPEDPDSVAVEVLLQLSAMKHQPLTVEDLPALRDFLGSGPEDSRAAWGRWLGYLAGVDWRARSQRKASSRSSRT